MDHTKAETSVGTFNVRLEAETNNTYSRYFDLSNVRNSINSIIKSNEVTFYNYDLTPVINGKEYQGLVYTVRLRHDGELSTWFKSGRHDESITDAAHKKLEATVGEELRSWYRQNLAAHKMGRRRRYLESVKLEMEETRNKAQAILDELHNA